MTPEQERELLQCIHLDRKEFGLVFDQFYKPIFGYLYRRTGDYDVARDMAAETFLKAFLKIESFQWRGISLSAWLYRIATNEANQHSRRSRYRPITIESILDSQLLRHAEDADERSILEAELKHHEEFLEIQKAMTSLDSRFQEVIALRYFEGKSLAEIAEILAKPEGTIKSLLSRGLEKLRKMIR